MLTRSRASNGIYSMKCSIITILAVIGLSACESTATAPQITVSSPRHVVIKGPPTIWQSLPKCGQDIFNMAEAHCQKTDGYHAVIKGAWMEPFVADFCSFECEK